MFKKLDIFVFKNFITLFFGTFAISLFVVMMQFLWKYVDDLVGKGLGMDVLGKFFFYAAETLVPMALPLAILLASLISFGNMGERLELLAIKAAGVSLWRTMRPLVVLMVFFTGLSFYVQNVIAPKAQENLTTLIYSIRQTSPELSIPEGVFYDGVEGMNLYVKKKDKQTGMLYEVIIYNMRDGANNAHIILADSGKLETTADKEHLLLHLFNGEQFENLRSNALNTNNIPYRRETFVQKHFIIDFDQNVKMADLDFSSSARTKDIARLIEGVDSMQTVVDSTAHQFYDQMQHGVLYVAGVTDKETTPQQPPIPTLSKGADPVVAPAAKQPENVVATSLAKEEHKDESLDIDTLFAHLNPNQQHRVVQQALQKTLTAESELEWKAEEMKVNNRSLRMHRIQIWDKITSALACLVFFFIGAPLGAIIRKGGLGMPVVVAVIIFIFYYITNRLGYNLAYAGTIPEVVGMWYSTVILSAIGIFFTVKSNNDSTVFNIDSYTAFFRRLWGIRQKRHIVRKEVIINDPDYATMSTALLAVADEAHTYRSTQHLTRFPNYIQVFFRSERDEEIAKLSDQLEYCVDSLSNSKDKQILLQLNAFPVLDAYAHTAPFRNRTWNICAGVFVPLGIVLVFRISRFRRRLRRDLKQVMGTGERISKRCEEIVELKAKREGTAPTPLDQILLEKGE